MEEKKISPLYRMIRWAGLKLYPAYTLVGAENLPDEPAVIVGNHCQLHGPMACELFFPGKHDIWTAGQMLHLKEVPPYAFQDFWSQKPRYTHWFYKLASYAIAPLSVCIFNNADTIGVYHDFRIVSTFKQTISRLHGGRNVIIFPEFDEKYNNILYNFQDKFIDTARFYYKKTGKALSFVPMYIAPRLKKICLGKPIQFQTDAPIEQERQRIRTYLMDEITRVACALPVHTVVPYRNIPKRLYPPNIPLCDYRVHPSEEVAADEKAGG